ncbi:hypothetical protein DRO27_03690, partial [Candidatus Bathyarchaeota archaeon]
MKVYDVTPTEPPMTDKVYLTFKGMYCPICGVKGDLSTFGDLEQDDTYISQGVHCSACGAEYNDRYELVGYYHAETEDQKSDTCVHPNARRGVVY